MSFYEEIQQYNWNEISKDIYSKTPNDVQNALLKENLSLSDFQALISPAAAPFIEQMAKRSMEITQKRFGKTIQLYIPIYLSNSCTNSCIYCGFNHTNKIDRVILTREQVLKEANLIRSMGFEHLLLVTGEDKAKCGVDYLNAIMYELKDLFSHLSIEVQPLSVEEYKLLRISGLNTVYVYQETYHEKNYRNYHPKGKKSNFQYRLETPDRIGQAGIHKIGLGCLLGLEDWRVDSFFTALHLSYLEKKYWQTKYSIAFPRLRPHTGSFQSEEIVGQKELLQLICAYRIFNEQIELSLSTRESANFRDNVLKLGVTSYSAGSKTNPGGYSDHSTSLEQFAIDDNRSPVEVTEMIKQNGYEVVWKDWDYYLQS